MKKLSTLEIISAAKTLNANVEDLKTAIKALRTSSGWENGIENDRRKSVQLLYAEYTTACTELKKFNATLWSTANYAE